MVHNWGVWFFNKFFKKSQVVVNFQWFLASLYQSNRSFSSQAFWMSCHSVSNYRFLTWRILSMFQQTSIFYTRFLTTVSLCEWYFYFMVFLLLATCAFSSSIRKQNLFKLSTFKTSCFKTRDFLQTEEKKILLTKKWQIKKNNTLIAKKMAN